MDLNNRKLKIIHSPPSEESHPVTDSLEKTVEETGDKQSLPNLNTIIMNKIWYYFVRNQHNALIKLMCDFLLIQSTKMHHAAPIEPVTKWIHRVKSNWEIMGDILYLKMEIAHTMNFNVRSHFWSKLWHGKIFFSTLYQLCTWSYRM